MYYERHERFLESSRSFIDNEMNSKFSENLSIIWSSGLEATRGPWCCGRPWRSQARRPAGLVGHPTSGPAGWVLVAGNTGASATSVERSVTLQVEAVRYENLLWGPYRTLTYLRTPRWTQASTPSHGLTHPVAAQTHSSRFMVKSRTPMACAHSLTHLQSRPADFSPSRFWIERVNLIIKISWRTCWQ